MWLYVQVTLGIIVPWNRLSKVRVGFLSDQELKLTVLKNPIINTDFLLVKDSKTFEPGVEKED